MASAAAARPALARHEGGARARLRPTRTGATAVLVSAAILGAALNTGNNLLYLLAALILTALPVSAVVALRMLRRAELELFLPGETTAGEVASAALRLRASGPGLAGLRLVHDAPDGAFATVVHLPAGATAVRTLPLPTSRRGPLAVATRLECLFPWGLLAGLRSGPSGELLVLPRPEGGAARPSLLGGGLDGRETRHPGRSQDLLEIRDYRVGDDARAIDWKATARKERPMVRQGTREDEPRVAVIVDPSPPPGDESSARDAVERAIARAAGALTSLAREGWQVRLVLPGGEQRGSELEQLRSLARLEVPSKHLPAGWWRGRLGRGEPHVLCRAEPES